MHSRPFGHASTVPAMHCVVQIETSAVSDSLLHLPLRQNSEYVHSSPI